jgi:uncharacterized membrane protein YwaF
MREMLDCFYLISQSWLLAVPAGVELSEVLVMSGFLPRLLDYVIAINSCHLSTKFEPCRSRLPYAFGKLGHTLSIIALFFRYRCAISGRQDRPGGPNHH